MEIDYDFEKLNIHFFNENRTDFYEIEISQLNKLNKMRKEKSKDLEEIEENFILDQNIEGTTNKDNLNKFMKKNKSSNMVEINPNDISLRNKKENLNISINSKDPDEKVNLNKNSDILKKIGESNNNNILENKYTLVICIAMYAEEYELINNTLEGISENLQDLEHAGFPNEKILILIIADGIEKVNPEVKEKFTKGKIKDKETMIKNHMNSFFGAVESKEIKKSPNYLISCSLQRKATNPYKTNENPNIKNEKKMDILFCIKSQNKGKLDSHFWLFMGFCKKINPKYIILLDTGTIPDPGRTLADLVIPMKIDNKIAGTCGEMILSNYQKCTNFILCAQILEYKYSHVIDKNFENLFGFISVLPGAFSAYSWECLNSDENSLKEYFKIIDEGYSSCEIANRYLAEDRIFCFTLFSLKNRDYRLKYIPDSLAKTDAPEIYGEFLLQRRRWINGSNFALFYNLGIYPKVCQTSHKVRQIFIFILFLYYFIQAILSYFILGTFYFGYYMICMKMTDNRVLTVKGYVSKQSVETSFVMSVYFFVIIFCIISSLIIKPLRDVSKIGKISYRRSTIFKIFSFILGMYNIISFGLAIYAIFRNNLPLTGTNNTSLIETYKDYSGAIFLISVGFATYLLPLIIEPSMIVDWIKNFMQYLFMQPTYMIVFSIFSVCNIDDVSWGNRETTNHVDPDKFKLYKIRYLFIWLIFNFIQGWGFSYIVIETSYDKALVNTYSYIIAILGTFKLVCAIGGKIKYYAYDRRIFRKDLSKDKETEKNNIKRKESKTNTEDKGIFNKFNHIPSNGNENKNEKIEKDEKKKFNLDHIAGEQIEGIVDDEIYENKKSKIFDHENEINLDIDIDNLEYHNEHQFEYEENLKKNKDKFLKGKNRTMNEIAEEEKNQ